MKTIEQAAIEDAREAIGMGAVAPWGDGETISASLEQLGKLHGLPALTRDQAREYDFHFRATIDAEAPRASLEPTHAAR